MGRIEIEVFIALLAVLMITGYSFRKSYSFFSDSFFQIFLLITVYRLLFPFLEMWALLGAFLLPYLNYLIAELLLNNKPEKTKLYYFLNSGSAFAALSLLVVFLTDFQETGSSFSDKLILFSLLLSIVLLSGAMDSLLTSRIKFLVQVPVLFILLHLFFFHNNFSAYPYFFAGLIVALAIAWSSVKLRFLSYSGGIATFILASLLFGFGGMKWSVPILTFFILSSILSKVRKKHNEEVELYFEKTGVRDHWQVLANGGAGGIFILIYLYTSYELFYLLYLASLAAVCADTWATEIGTYKRRKTYNILTFRPVEQGRSGGISLSGTLGAFAGALVIAVSGVFWQQYNYLPYFYLVLGAGLSGCFIDSIIGATIQQQFKCYVCEKITEKELHCGEKTHYYRGIKFINNDLVNFLAAVGAVIFIVFFF